MPAALEPFVFRFRVRYQECDGQKIVFNARWGDYVDLACTEYTRLVLGSVDPEVTGMDWRLVRQVTEWKAPARFDDVLDAAVHTVRIGTTSFTLATEFRRWPDGARLVTAETVYVVVDGAGDKCPVPEAQRRALEVGAPGRVVDHAGAWYPPPGS